MELTSVVQPPRYLTLLEAAERANCSTETLRRRIHAGELEAVRIGCSDRSPIRVREDVLEAWLNNPEVA